MVASNNAEILGTVVIVVVVVGTFLHRHAKSCKNFKVNFHNGWKKIYKQFPFDNQNIDIKQSLDTHLEALSMWWQRLFSFWKLLLLGEIYGSNMVLNYRL